LTTCLAHRHVRQRSGLLESPCFRCSESQSQGDSRLETRNERMDHCGDDWGTAVVKTGPTADCLRLLHLIETGRLPKKSRVRNRFQSRELPSDRPFKLKELSAVVNGCIVLRTHFDRTKLFLSWASWRRYSHTPILYVLTTCGPVANTFHHALPGT
jgi:hypothetical protein